MDEQESQDKKDEHLAKVYKLFPKPEELEQDSLPEVEGPERARDREQDSLPLPDDFDSDLDRVDFVYSRWLHPSMPTKDLVETIASQHFDERASDFSDSWNQAIEELAKNSRLFSDYVELLDDPEEVALKTLQSKSREIINILDEDMHNLRQALLVLMDLRSYAAIAGLDDRTLAVYEKLLKAFD